MARKNLDDVLYGDRADVRSASYHKPVGGAHIIDLGRDHGYTSERCYHKHPALNLGTGKLVGGSGSQPILKTAFAFIAFDGKPTIPPYDYATTTAPHSIHHAITDMHAPHQVKEFKKLVTWTAEQLKEGRTIHCGCFGGHGRTGTFISAVVKELTGEEDAIEWVREHYCHKAVESKEQVDFLHEHYGIKPTKGHKTGSHGKTTQTASSKGKAAGARDQVYTSIGDKYDIFK